MHFSSQHPCATELKDAKVVRPIARVLPWLGQGLESGMAPRFCDRPHGDKVLLVVKRLLVDSDEAES